MTRSARDIEIERAARALVDIAEEVAGHTGGCCPYDNEIKGNLAVAVTAYRAALDAKEEDDKGPPIGVVSHVNPDGSGEVELNAYGMSLFPPNCRVQLVPEKARVEPEPTPQVGVVFAPISDNRFDRESKERQAARDEALEEAAWIALSEMRYDIAEKIRARKSS